MRKLFLLIPALILSMIVNATIFEIDPGYNPDWESATGNISHTIGSNITDAGDTIVLRDGIYVENYSININHPVVIMADKGARPIVHAASYFGVYANVKVIGVTFKGTGEYAFYVQDATPKSLIFEDCEFSGYSKFVITGSSSKSDLDSCVINNCYFHDTGRGAVQFESSSSRTDGQNSCDYLKVTNTTIANISNLSGAIIDLRNKGNVVEGTDSLLVDHVTIYNWTGGSNGAIMGYKTKHVGIYNTIIAQPASNSTYGVYCYGGSVKNVLAFNVSHKDWTPCPTFVGEKTGDPLFVDAENGDYALSATSPAIGAALDGSNLGDPRWNAPSKYAHTDFSTPYAFTGDKAGVGGNVWRHADGYLYYNDKSVCGTAIWGIHATKSCAVKVQLNMNAATTTGHKFKVYLIDAKLNKIDSVAEKSQTTDGGNIDLNGTMYIPAEGDYFIKLHNLTGYSSSKIDGVTLSYAGGAVQNIPATTDISEAWYSAKGTRADDMISFESYTDQWVKWLVAVPGTTTIAYDVTLTINNPTEYGHNFSVAFYEIGAEEPAAIVSEKSWNKTYGEALALSLGSVELKGGKNYILKVTNAESGAKPKIISVSFTYSGGNVQNMPSTTNINDAWFSPNGTRANGKITYSNISGGCWAKWNIAVANAGTYNVIVNIQNQYGHNYVVEFLKEGSETPISVTEGETKYGHDETLYPVEVGAIALEEGNYVMTVSNAVGDAKLLSTTLAYAGGAAIDLSKNTPANLLANADAILSDDWSIEDGKITHAESKATTGWAKWNVECADAETYNVKVNISSDNGHLVRVRVYEGNAAQASITLDESTSTKWSTGNQTINLGNINLSSRDYIIEVSNTLPNSHVQIISINISYEGGATIDIPNAAIPFSEALLYNGATRDLESEPQQIHFESVDAYAQWNIHAEAGIYNFDLHVVGNDYGKYQLTIIDGENNQIYEEYKGKQNEGNVSHTNILLSEGDYTIRLANVNSGSHGYVTSFAASKRENLIILDENAISNTAISDNLTETKDVLIKRTFKGGIFNTICLPFGASLSKVKALFGNDVELLYMSGATLEDGVLDLEFLPAPDIYQGTPFLIKPSADVVNPEFSDVTIAVENPSATSHTGWAADFIGTFVKNEIVANPNNLYLGTDDKLYFSNNAVTIKGLRAYFHVKTTGNNAPAVRSARIVTPNNVPTEIDLVGTENNGTFKTIENGQLYILYNGQMYNIQGARVK